MNANLRRLAVFKFFDASESEESRNMRNYTDFDVHNQSEVAIELLQLIAKKKKLLQPKK